MNRMLSAGLLSTTILVSGFNLPAHAQALVHDPINFIELGLQLEQLIQAYVVLKNSYTQLEYTVASLQHLNAGSLATAQGLLSNAVRMPGSAVGQMPEYNFGSQLSGRGQQFYAQNHVYTPEGEDFAAQEMKRREYATANLQGEAQAGAQTANERIASLNELQASIADQPDVTAVGAINARIASEHLYLANEQAKNQHLQLMLATQDQVSRQRAEQHGREQLDDYAKAVAAQAWGN